MTESEINKANDILIPKYKAWKERELQKPVEDHYTKMQSQLKQRILEYMDKNKLNKKQMAQYLKYSNSHLYNLLNGKCNLNLKKLTDLLLAIDYIPKFSYL